MKHLIEINMILLIHHNQHLDDELHRRRRLMIKLREAVEIKH